MRAFGFKVGGEYAEQEKVSGGGGGKLEQNGTVSELLSYWNIWPDHLS